LAATMRVEARQCRARNTPEFIGGEPREFGAQLGEWGAQQ
jgi:hypothetical protein